MTYPSRDPDSYDLAAVAAEFLAFCEATGVTPRKGARDAWIAWPLRAVPKSAMDALGMGTIRAAACREVVPQATIPEGHYVKGVSTLVDKTGKAQIQWIKTAQEALSRDQVFERLLQDLPGKIAPREVVSPPVPEGLNDYLLSAYVMGDPHIGMLAWGPETGDDPFDLKIAEGTLIGAVRHLTAACRPTRRALLVNVGDFFHADNMSAVTSRSGNKLDVDSRPAKVLRVGVRCQVGAVEALLERHEFVHVINQPGNHDDYTSLLLSIAMDAYFRNEPRVTVDLSPARFHYHRFGKVLIGVAHGDARGASKAQDLESIMATDRAKDWGETEHRYWYTGHIHHRRAQDTRGALCESFRTLAPSDAWAAGEGYRSRAEMTAITLHADWGEIARASVSGKFLRSMMAGAT